MPTVSFTNQLNQDVIENLFSIFRQKGGYNRYQTVRIISTSFRSTSIYSLICTSKGTNCEQIEERYQEDLKIVDNLKNKIINEDESDTESSTLSKSSSSSTSASLNLAKKSMWLKTTTETVRGPVIAPELLSTCPRPNKTCHPCMFGGE